MYPTPKPPPIPPPIITVTVSSPVIQIVDVGQTIRLPCTGYHNIKQVRQRKAEKANYSIYVIRVLNFLDSNYGPLAQTRWRFTR